jgi:hypothetical protein
LTNNSQKSGDEILRLIEADHDDTTQFIARLIGLQSTTRTIAVTLVSALAGFALANHSPIMAMAGVPIVLLAVGSEVRSSYMLRLAHQRSTLLERTIQTYVISLRESASPVSDVATNRWRDALDIYEFGLSRSLRNVPWQKAVGQATRGATFWFYLVLLALLVVVALLGHTESPRKIDACIRSDSGAVVEVRGSAAVLSGHLTVIPCPK